MRWGGVWSLRGGNKNTRGRGVTFEGGRILYIMRHHPMTKVARLAFFARREAQEKNGWRLRRG